MAIRSREIRIALLSAILLALIGFAQRWHSVNSRPAVEPLAAADDRPSPLASADRVPISASPKSSVRPPVTPARQVAAKSADETRARTSDSGDWAIIAATYNAFGAAAKRAASLRSQFAECSCSVFPREGEGQKYYVIVGSSMTRDAAEAFLQRAIDAGLPEDTYITRLTPQKSPLSE
jgi:hypothetical protein